MDGFYKYGQSTVSMKPTRTSDGRSSQPYWDMAEQYVLADEMFPDGVWRQLHRRI